MTVSTLIQKDISRHYALGGFLCLSRPTNIQQIVFDRTVFVAQNHNKFSFFLFLSVLYHCNSYNIKQLKPFKIKLKNHFLFTELQLTSVLRKTSYTHYMLRALKILIKQFILIILFSYEMRSTFGNLRPKLQLYFPLWILYEFISSWIKLAYCRLNFSKGFVNNSKFWTSDSFVSIVEVSRNVTNL